MYIEDLMSGDWIKVGKDVYRYSIPVHDVHRNLIGIWMYNTHRQRFYTDCKNFEPVPLTPEILEKNGFEDVGYDTWKLIDKPHYFCVDFFNHRYSCELVSINGEYKVAERILNLSYSTPFVHELQHILRLCGIEKEILL